MRKVVTHESVRRIAITVFFSIIVESFVDPKEAMNLKKNYFWLRWVFIAAWELFLGVVIGGYAIAVLRRLLVVVASLVAEHKLYVRGLQ